ncbi:MAG: phage holin family protein [Ruminococcaceae bacterium]|nr:phage holin family protein [Oscillospiraceae bacterium]
MAGGVLCTALTLLFGGLDAVLWTLIAFIALDYVTGIVVAVANKTLSSTIGFKGLLKKMVIFIVVAVGHLVGQVVEMQEIRSFVIGFYIANEGISILENAGKMGVSLPERLLSVLEQLQEKEK